METFKSQFPWSAFTLAALQGWEVSRLHQFRKGIGYSLKVVYFSLCSVFVVVVIYPIDWLQRINILTNLRTKAVGS